MIGQCLIDPCFWNCGGDLWSILNAGFAPWFPSSEEVKAYFPEHFVRDQAFGFQPATSN